MNPDGKQHDVDVVLSDKAIEWLVRLNSGRATAEDREAFSEWRLQSDEHELAAREAEAVWHGIGIAGNRAREAERKTRLTRRAVLGGTVLVAGGVVLERSGIVGPRLFADYVTGVGEQRTVRLPDGSTALLNAGTALDVDFSEGERRLTLLEGQATFTVAHDVARPFVVEAIGGQTRAIGTVFDIDIRPQDVAVTVIEGMVCVTTDAAQDALVQAGVDRRVRYVPGGLPFSAELVDADAETAWRRGKLIFNHRPFGDVVAEIERYRQGRIVIASGRLRSLEVTGVFETSDPETILRTIADTLPVRITRLPFVTILR